MTSVLKKALALSLVILILDRLSKHWILNIYDLPSLGQVEILPFFSLTMVWNRGISLGLFQANSEMGTYFLIGLTAVITIVLLIWLWSETKPMVAFALALVIGGSLGNIWDRVNYGAVADFLHFHVSNYNFYVFNVADAAITLGVVFMLWDALLLPQKSTK
jgi:signal peptidase II